MKKGHTYPRPETLAMRARMLGLAARPEGATRDDFTGSRSNIMKNLQLLERSGALCGHGVWKMPRRYFTTTAARDAFAERSRVVRKAKAPRQVTPPTGKPAPVAFKGTRAWWPADAEPVITSATKVTIAPTPPAPRWTNTHARLG